MTGLRANYNEENKKAERSAQQTVLFYYFYIFVVISFLLCTLNIPGLSIEVLISGVALQASFLAILLSNLYYFRSNRDKFKAYIVEDQIREYIEEKDQIRYSIDMFYLPLYSLLTAYDENVNNIAKKQRIAEINCHKHTAESETRSYFEKYIKNNEGDNEESNKLLELVNKDIEFLQNRFIEINMELKGK